jgi:hypothetical protein
MRGLRGCRKSWQPRTTTKKKTKGAAIPDWTPIGLQNIAQMIEAANAGDVDEARRAVDLAARELAEGRALPQDLATWMGGRLHAVLDDPERAGQQLGVSATRGGQVEPYQQRQAFEEMVANAVFAEMQAGASKDLACERIADWLTEQGVLNARGEPYSAGTVRKNFWEPWARAVRDHHARVQHELDSD